jgi:hypothetical protein
VQKALLLFCCSITLTLHSYSQNAIDNLIPQLPVPHSATMPVYSNTQPTTLGTTINNINDIKQQQPDPFQPTNEDKRRIEQNRREAMLNSIEKLDRTLPKRTVLDADLDTVFGHPPVISQSTYQATKSYWDALVFLLDMSEGKRKFSLTEAVYTVENTYLKNRLSKDEFYGAIKLRADLAKQIMKREQLDPNNNLAKNYAIQKQFSQENKYTLPTGKEITIPRLGYDFHDFLGDTNHTQVFVSKLLATNIGQCHSMPLLYLAIAEQLNAQAYLSHAPDHLFIKFSDGDGSMYNFETTNGCVVSDSRIMQSGYITATAIRNKVFLDTLSQQRLLAMFMYDLAISYHRDYGFDGFTETALKYAMPLDPNGVQGEIVLSRFWEAKTKKAEQYYHTRTKEEFEQNPVTSAMYRNLQKVYDAIDASGYRKMPPDAYAAWLKAVGKERDKQDEQLLKQQLQYLMNNTKVNTTKK